jgi:hypothetical protein
VLELELDDGDTGEPAGPNSCLAARVARLRDARLRDAADAARARWLEEERGRTDRAAAEADAVAARARVGAGVAARGAGVRDAVVACLGVRSLGSFAATLASSSERTGAGTPSTAQ